MFEWEGDGVVVKGYVYGMRSICVDGNDIFVMYVMVKVVWKMVVEESWFIFIEVELKFIFYFFSRFKNIFFF